MMSDHKEEELKPYARARKNTCQSLKRKRLPASPVVTTLPNSNGNSVRLAVSVCVCLSVSLSHVLSFFVADLAVRLFLRDLHVRFQEEQAAQASGELL